MKYFTYLLFIFFSIQGNAQIKSTTTLSTALSSGKTYGAYCGIAGQHPPTRIITEELIAMKDTFELSSWLTSPNLVIQTYAAEAFIRLANQGMEIDHEILVLVFEIKNRSDLINTCKGCIYERRPIKECLIEFDFEPHNDQE